ncbi:hypothetical protein BDY19DRAFT_929008 [Irpex rosettiformis]|uniref:Uncharacterized protein n=1 Tax=Irpex rosettiformis TaxID=378272 RepID=A0ACB8UD44_9APHY|nr:hypothetical protein BDY19DRAFT_929008 [Irpex rosettiformis]
MADNRGVCRFYANEGKCRFGTKCKFSHSNATSSPGPHRRNGTSLSPSSPGPGGSRPRNGTQALPQPGPASNVPRGVCRIYWGTGTCERLFDCSFKHVKGSVASASTLATTQPGVEEPPDFFSAEGLAVNSGATRLALDPSSAHNNILSFLRDNYRFENASKMQGFINVVASVNDRNKNWNSDTAQSFLDTMVKGNGVIRIGDILHFESVSIRASPGALSFQRGYFPIFEFMSSDIILKTTIHKNINHLYTLVENNFDAILDIVNSCMDEIITSRTWADPNPYSNQNDLSGVVVFKALSTLFLEYFHRFKDCIKNHPQIDDIVNNLERWFTIWSADVSSPVPKFDDPIIDKDRDARRLIIGHIRANIERLVDIVSRESGRSQQLRRNGSQDGSRLTAAQRRQAAIVQLAQAYDPPGELREAGPRHDNDFEDISQIRIAPTHEELLCESAYLPVFSPHAPHHLREGSMERHLDIQFRLLREELVSPIRASVMAIYNDVFTMSRVDARQKKGRSKTILQELIQKRGGAYKTSGFDSVFFHVYTNVRFSPMKAERRSLTVGLSLDAPKAARNEDRKKRYAYWEYSKRLQSGSLIVLVMITGDATRIYLGVAQSSSKDIAESSRASEDTIQIQVSFFDSEVEWMALRNESMSSTASSHALLLDNSVMYEASRPFLERLQSIEPTQIPFARYIARHDSVEDVQVLPPKYATAPGFKFKLQCLVPKGSRHVIDDLDISRPMAVENARRQLQQGSTLDPSQLDAVINSLIREVSLVQGPPGTGKSYTGREILKVLFASKVKPIVLIAYTNHALDHMLTEILDSNITTNIVRLGSRSSDERIAEFTLDKLEQISSKSNLDRNIGRQYRVMKELEEEMSDVMRSIQLPVVSWDSVHSHLSIHYTDHGDAFEAPPFWIQELFNRMQVDEEENGVWQEVKGKGKQRDDPNLSKTLYGFWKEGKDIEFITPVILEIPVTKKKGTRPKGPSKPQAQAQGPAVFSPLVIEFFQELGFGSMLPPVPSTTRPLETLRNVPTVWGMSLDERTRLAYEWEREIRDMAYRSNLGRYNRVRDEYKEACKDYNDIRDETRRRLLTKVDLIACTTTGAAKLTSLLNSVSLRVLMVEEAGQVLEAHILTSLVTSVHHLICIGDPQQLRPNLATYSLSMDSERGKELYKFDRSLMERLHDAEMPMTQINVQRRMRPSISHFIRTILYERLEDNEIVFKYPSVQGMRSDVYFLNHTNAEGGAEDSVSKYNDYEVAMIRDLVLYFLRQGVYNGEGDIAVLCAYLGQLQKVRAALRDLKIAVSIDERDEDQLAKQGLEEEVAFQEVTVAKHIRLGTVDIFQGQEAKIVIVSLVRNTGTFETQSASIGFLKSSNRINVALSRAKHGLYILGNASNLRKNPTWSTIVDELESRDQIGPALPIVCVRHPDQAQLVSKPGELSRFAPGGGCLLPCATKMPCGHVCPSVCHDTRDNHRSTFCAMPCSRTPCPRKHPCDRKCSENCGDCRFPMYNVRLPCGHVIASVPCHLYDNLSEVTCSVEVTKKLPCCEHSAVMSCNRDASNWLCQELCDGIMSCGTKTCKNKCFDCQRLSTPPDAVVELKKVVRSTHKTHPCERTLYCQHLCALDCHPKENGCNSSCQGECRQRCSHHRCDKPCSTPCAPCMEECEWRCPHQECPVACGSICARLPCDEPCSNILECGHPCPSVCGEKCEDQICVECLPEDSAKKQDIVDFIMQRTLADIDLTSTDLENRLITLECQHIFTVETLDGHCSMTDYYEIDPMGQYLSLKAPPVNYQLPPVCPTCRGTITAQRYGRVTKRAILDVLEQNVTGTMSRSLELLNPELERIATGLSTFETNAKNIAPDPDSTSEPSFHRGEDAKGKITEPLPITCLDSSAMHNIHGFSATESKAWNTVAGDLIKLYRQAHAIATKRGAHVQAYEAAVTTLYRLELLAVIANPEPEDGRTGPETRAIEAARRDVGQPPHKADSKFQVEAYHRTLELRFMLAQIAQSRIEGLPATLTDDKAIVHRGLWVSFVDFIYQSCEADAKKALEMAETSSASRQVAHCSVYMTRAQFEKERFKVMVAEKKLPSISQPMGRTAREQLANGVDSQRRDINHQLVRMQAVYLRSRPMKTAQDIRAEQAWFTDNCHRKIEKYLKELEKLAEFVRKGGTYEALSVQEMEDIVKAFDFGYTGHFYRCPNGHPYVIGECGGAMQQGRCNECGEAIGGGSHTLLSSNNTATEFESILRRNGAGQGFY